MRMAFETACSFIALVTFSLLVGLLPPSVAPHATNSVRPKGEEHKNEEPTVAILPPVLDVYAAIDDGFAHVIAVSSFVRKVETSAPFGHLFPQSGSLPLAGIDGAIPDPERILLLRPDNVVVSRMFGKILHEIGYHGLIELNSFSPKHLLAMWTTLGKLANHEQRAEALWATADLMRRDLRARLPKSSSIITVLPMTPIAGGTWWIGTKSFGLNSMFERLGAVNPAQNLLVHGPADPEEVLRLDPDYILMPAYDDAAVPQRIYGDGLWQSLKAVRLKQVYRAPLVSVFNMPVDETLSFIWLAELLHPSLPHLTRSAYRRIYEHAYHYNLSDDEIDGALFLRQNMISAGYERFARATAFSRRN